MAKGDPQISLEHHTAARTSMNSFILVELLKHLHDKGVIDLVTLMPEMKQNLASIADTVDDYTVGVVAMQIDALANYPNRLKGPSH